MPAACRMLQLPAHQQVHATATTACQVCGWLLLLLPVHSWPTLLLSLLQPGSQLVRAAATAGPCCRYCPCLCPPATCLPAAACRCTRATCVQRGRWRQPGPQSDAAEGPTWRGRGGGWVRGGGGHMCTCALPPPPPKESLGYTLHSRPSSLHTRTPGLAASTLAAHQAYIPAHSLHRDLPSNQHTRDLPACTLPAH